MLTAEVPAAVLDRDAVGRALARLVAVCDLLHEESSAFLGDWAAPKPIAPTVLLERYAAEVAELEAPTEVEPAEAAPNRSSRRGPARGRDRSSLPIAAGRLRWRRQAVPLGGRRRRGAHAPRRPGAWRDPAGAGGRRRGGHGRDHARRPAGQASGACRCRAAHPQRSAAHDRRRRVHRLGRPALGDRRPRPGHARQGHARRGRLPTTIRERDGFDQVAFDLRPDLPFGKTATVRISYDLPDGGARSASPIRVGRAYISFYAFAHGDDRATLTIEVPGGLRGLDPWRRHHDQHRRRRPDDPDHGWVGRRQPLVRHRRRHSAGGPPG